MTDHSQVIPFQKSTNGAPDVPDSTGPAKAVDQDVRPQRLERPVAHKMTAQMAAGSAVAKTRALPPATIHLRTTFQLFSQLYGVFRFAAHDFYHARRQRTHVAVLVPDHGERARRLRP